MLGIRLDDALHEAVADDVLAAEAHEVYPLDALEDLPHDDQAGTLVLGQVDLRDVAGDDHLRVEAQPREDHLHLLRRRVLRLVEDDEAVIERPSAHECQWRDLDLAALEERGDLLRLEHVVQRVEQRAQVRVDLRHQVARQEAEALAGLDRGAREDDAVDVAAAQRGGRQRDGEERLAGAGRTDPERHGVAPDRVDVALLVDGLRRDLLGAVAPDDVLEDLRGRSVLVERGGHRGDRAGGDLVALLDQPDELLDDGRGGPHGLGLTVERDDVAAQVKPAFDVALERSQDGVAAAGELCCDLVGDLDLLTHPAPLVRSPTRACRRRACRPSPSWPS
jgi:hypothetical protein